jgi:hypothetical protein
MLTLNRKEYPVFLTPKAGAGIAGVSLRTFYKWLHSEDGPPALRANSRQIRLPRDSFFDWLEGRAAAGLDRLSNEQERTLTQHRYADK